MQVIIDCGSTKADWLIVGQGRDQRLESTTGFNPYLIGTEEIYTIIKQQLLDKLEANAIEMVYFYGTGIHDDVRAEMVAVALRRAFPKAKVHVWHDLLASARATCGREPGICCILGTGSNSCYYDGESILDNVPSLGWLVGDEGSGNHLGKALLRAYVYRELPIDLEQAFEKAYPEGIDVIKDKIYDLSANAYLASFTRFLGDHLSHPVVRDLVETSLGEFLDRHVAKYKAYKKVPIHFVGSISHHFSSVLLDCMKKRDMTPGAILRKPIFSLADYHALGDN